MWLLMLLFSNTLRCVSQTAAHRANPLEVSKQETEGWGLFLLLFRFSGSYHSYSPAYMKENCKKLNANGWGRWCCCHCLFDDEVYAPQSSWASERYFPLAVSGGNKLTNKQKLVFFVFLIPMCSATALWLLWDFSEAQHQRYQVKRAAFALKRFHKLNRRRRNSTMTPPFWCHAEERQQVWLRAGPVAPP